MKIAFFGTPEFAAVSLKELYSRNYDVAAVITQPDKARDRGKKISYSPVKKLAMSYDALILQPSSLRCGDVDEILRNLNVDLIVVVAYGKLIPQSILNIPRFGCINIHASLLPKYRGASPILHAILNGDCITGVTAMYLSDEMDAGDMISSKSIEISDDDTTLTLTEKLGLLGAKLLIETIDDIKSGKVIRKAQDHNLATYAPLISKSMSPINWNNTCLSILNKIRAFIPWPVATMKLGDKVLQVYSAEICCSDSFNPAGDNCGIGAAPGDIISCDKDGIKVAGSDGHLLITKVKAPGKNVMSAADYLRGNPYEA